MNYPLKKIFALLLFTGVIGGVSGGLIVGLVVDGQIRSIVMQQYFERLQPANPAGALSAPLAQRLETQTQGSGLATTAIPGTTQPASAASSSVTLDSAQSNSPSFKKDCRKELESFCGGIEPGGGRYQKCLIKHKSELGAVCRRVVEALSK